MMMTVPAELSRRGLYSEVSLSDMSAIFLLRGLQWEANGYGAPVLRPSPVSSLVIP
jgi:hypothetical protein